MPTGSEFQRVDFRPQNSNYRPHGEERTGEFDQGATAPAGPAPPKDTYPNLGDSYGAGANPFSSDKAETPQEMARESGDSQNSFAELQQHLNNSLDTPGSRVAHPRDQMWRPPHGAEGE